MTIPSPLALLVHFGPHITVDDETHVSSFLRSVSLNEDTGTQGYANRCSIPTRHQPEADTR